MSLIPDSLRSGEPMVYHFLLSPLTELSVKPSLASTLIPSHAQRNSAAASSSASGTSSNPGPAVVDGAVASISTPVS